MAEVNDRLIESWMEARDELLEAKKMELMLRNMILKSLLGDKQGSYKHRKDTDRFRIVAESKVTNKFDDAVVMSVLHALPKAEQEAFSNKLSISDAKYRDLPKDSEIHKYVTQFPAQATLSVRYLHPEDEF